MSEATRKTILLADDDADLLHTLTLRCKQLGLEVVSVADAMTALSTADFMCPDLICLDVEMPNGNGLAACEMISSDDRFTEIPLLIMTGRKDEATIRRCQEMGAHYLAKGGDLWRRMEVLIRELGLVEPAGAASPMETF